MGDHFERFLDEQIESGRYNNASEVVRAGLPLLEDHENDRVLKLDELRRAVQAGRDSGRGRSASVVFDEVEARIRKQLKKRA